MSRIKAKWIQLKQNLRNKIWNYNRRRLNRASRRRFNNPDVSIICSNCIGGMLSHDLGIRFNSPTVNLFMMPEHFVRFCENLEYYLSLDDMTPCTDPAVLESVSYAYPVACLDDLLIYMMHYSTFEEAKQKWMERKKRVNMDNLAIMASDRDGMTEDQKNRFDALPYKKVYFTNHPDKKHPSAFYIRGYENEPSVGVVIFPCGWFGKRPVDQFDWVRFLNKTDEPQS